jgi:release factor glutamine methyltransferase
MTSVTTLGSVLHDAAERLRGAGIDDADLEADVLLRHALGMDDDRAHMLALLHEPIRPDAASRLDDLVRRRLAHEPTAYIVGFREFYGLKLACSPDALIPRPETELLVEIALDWLAHLEAAHRPLIVDVGTGNGALAIALAVNCPAARVIAVDTSAQALQLAQRNAESHGVATRVSVVRGDLLSPLRAPADLIVANLPYVSEPDWDALAPEIRAHEPRSALVGGRTGTEAIARLLAQAPALLNARSLLLCECGDVQADALRIEAVRAFPDAWIEVRQDLAGLDRALYVER